MLKFHCIVHRAPELKRCGPRVMVNGHEIEPLALSAPPPALPVTFDVAAQQLTAIEGLHLEPDGWFVWGRRSGGHRWQVDGQLTDGGERLEFVELRGRCPEEALDVLLAALGSAREEPLVQLVREGVYVDLPTFKRVSAGGA